MGGLLARVVMFGSWVGDAVWMELLHGGSLRLFLFFLRPLCNTQEKIKCNMNFLDEYFLPMLLSSVVCSCVMQGIELNEPHTKRATRPIFVALGRSIHHGRLVR